MEEEILEELAEQPIEEVVKTRLVQIDDELHCRFVEYIPSEELDESKQIYISDEDRLAIGQTKCFDLENNCVIEYDNTEDLERERKQELRRLREPLLLAFDKYKSNVNYGVEFESEEQREEIIKWYGNLLHLEESALDIIPERIRYYL